MTAAMAALIAGATAMVATPATAETTTAKPASLSWHDCGGTQKSDCTTIKVPVDWAKPKGTTFDLAVGRLPALDPKHRIGVLLVNPGGPGVSGIDYYMTGGFFKDDNVLRQRFDIVSWDPRGVERSHPVQCSQDLLGKAPTDFPNSAAAYKSLLAYNAELGADCRAHTGPLFDHVDTVSTIRDMDAIRAALGERKLSYLGGSYGTQIGQQYAERFPGRVRAMTIDSNMDHSITSAYRYLETATRDFESSFNAFADWCARTSGCALHGKDVRALWDGLYAKAEKGTLTDPANGAKIDANALRDVAFSPMYRPGERWAALATRLAALANGNPTARTLASPARPAHADLGENSYQAIWCQDWKWQVSGYSELQRYRKSLAKIAPHTRMSQFWSDITSCLGWPSKVTNPQHRLSVRTSTPILVTASKYDVATPHVWSTAVAKQIPSARLLQYDGVGHGDYRNSPCAKGYIETYLTALKVPPAGTHCAAVWPTGAATTIKAAEEPSRPVHS
ncbi:alpha/beta hydrolase [Actinoallomurus purpureus]|uniref:alpha/beta hydrolase n=1 Tax=Actinoallomurus purpureus TaxID=478114 RepID=UPI002093E62F|nr:alpha/beta hydrolase [Actinoallomurus purpureus]MCO6009099.1 alpha/beta hydrolase [Actinoallomurus purpureus]